jgi:colanic acid biosynthesis protein WcaH
MENKFIEEDLYKQICTQMPIPCVDIVFQNKDGRFLLVKRLNEPLKSQFWVPGGRILKSETSLDACVRKCKDELGLEIDSANFNFLGFYEADFNQNNFDVDGGYHVVSLVYDCSLIVDESKITLDSQSSEFDFFTSLPEEFTDYFKKTPVVHIKNEN